MITKKENYVSFFIFIIGISVIVLILYPTFTGKIIKNEPVPSGRSAIGGFLNVDGSNCKWNEWSELKENEASSICDGIIKGWACESTYTIKEDENAKFEYDRVICSSNKGLIKAKAYCCS